MQRFVQKKPKLFDANNCFLCEKKTPEKLVCNPSPNSFDLLSDALNKLLPYQSQGTLKVPHIVGENCSQQLLREVDARWHLSCYKKYTLKKTLNSDEKRFTESMFDNAATCNNTEGGSKTEEFSASSTRHFTRSNSTIYTKDVCFFCDVEGDNKNPLHHVSCDSTGSSLQRAVELSSNDLWRVRLSESISPGDAHAIDVLYHKECWRKNVFHVLRKTQQPNNAKDNVNKRSTAAVASDVEFLRMVEDFLSEGNVTSMSDLHTTYLNVCSSNGLDAESCEVRSRRNLKQFLCNEVPDIVFTPAKQKNSSERVSFSVTRDAAMWKLEEETDEHQLKTLMKVALAIRKICDLSKKMEIQWKSGVCSRTCTE